jgi:TRAP-type C4-dicarboxylate transport system substrate-binding protein
MKRAILLLCAVFLLLLCAGVDKAAAQASKAPVMRLKIADMTPASSDTALLFEWWANEVEKATGGRLKFDRYYSGSLVGAYEQLNAVKTGIIHVTPYYSGYHPDMAPLPLIGLMPMMHRGTIKQALLSSDDLSRNHSALQAEFKKNNVKYLFQCFFADNYIYSKKPIASLNDLKGKTFRAYGPFLAFFKELGAGVVSLPVPEIYEALDRGAVDATIQYLANAMGARYYEIVKNVNITEVGHNVGCPAVMNLATWNKLPKDVQDIIEGINRKAIEKGIGLHNEVHSRDMKILESRKMNLIKFSPEEVKQMIEVAKTKVWLPYAQGLDKKGIQGTKVLQDYLDLVEKYGK